MGRLINDTKSTPESSSEDRLSSWKEVAVYLGVSVRTVQRWEKIEGLPVNRHQHESRSTIYAFKSALDAWIEERFSSFQYSGDIPQPDGFQQAAGKDINSISSGISVNPSIAILPFVNFSDLKKDEYLCDALVEELINSLSRIPGLRVTARTSSFAFRGKSGDVREIGAKLNVKTILEGSLAKEGNRIRISARLIGVSDGFQIWSGLYDRIMTDILSIQDDICQTIAKHLRVSLTTGCTSQVIRHSGNFDAYTLFLRGRRQQSLFDLEGLKKSKEYFERALVLDPNYSLASVGIGMSHLIRGFLCLASPREIFPLCESAIINAVETDSCIAEAHALQGCLHVMRDFNWEDARNSFRRAFEIDPESVDSRDLYNFFFLLPRGNLDSPFESAKREISRNPLSPWLYLRLAYRYFLKRDFERSEASIRKALELDSDCYPLYWLMANILFQKGNYDEAVQASERHCLHAARGPWAMGYLGYACAKAGRVREALKILEKLTVIYKSRYVPPSSFAPLYFGLEDNDLGFDWLYKGLEERDFTLIHLAVDPFWDFIRPDPRFDGLLQKMNL